MAGLVASLVETLTDGWGLWGICGTMLFSGSFLVQWIASERRGESVIPLAFWYLRLAGGLMLFTYAFAGRGDGVFTLGQTFGVVVYSRNLVLIHRTRRAAAAAEDSAADDPGAE